MGIASAILGVGGDCSGCRMNICWTGGVTGSICRMGVLFLVWIQNGAFGEDWDGRAIFFVCREDWALA